MTSVQFTDYDRITDNIYYLSENLSLNFTVTLSRKNMNNERVFFHYETEYTSKYIGENIARAVKRIMSFYFTIDNKNDFGNGLILKVNDVAILNMIIQHQLLPHYFGNKRIYKIIDNRLVIKGEFEPIVYAQNEYKFLSFTPIVCEYEDGSFKEGVRITVNSEYVDIDIDRFMGFYYLLKNTDMYSVACSMVAYIKSAPYGINIYSRKGLGGGAPLPDENWNETNNKQTKENTNKFLDSLKQK